MISVKPGVWTIFVTSDSIVASGMLAGRQRVRLSRPESDRC